MTAMARNGSYVAFVYEQNDDNDGTDGTTTNDNEGFKVVIYDTSRDLSSGTSPVSTSLDLTANIFFFTPKRR